MPMVRAPVAPPPCGIRGCAFSARMATRIGRAFRTEIGLARVDEDCRPDGRPDYGFSGTTTTGGGVDAAISGGDQPPPSA